MIEFTKRALQPSTSRYIEVYTSSGEFISRHTSEYEAVQSVSEQPPGDYELRFPGLHVKVVGSVAPTSGDTQAPTEPGSLTTTVLSATQIRADWSASTDNVAVTGYQLFLDGAAYDTTAGTSYTFSDLTPSTGYSIEVAAFDAAGNNSTRAGPSLSTTQSNNPPVWSLGNQSGEVSDAFSLDLDSVCTDVDGDTITYTLESGTLPAGLSLSGSRNELLSGTLSEEDVDVFTLGASDGIAAVQTVQVTFTVTATDTTAPSAPTGLALENVAVPTLDLNWDDNAETDLDYYTVYRSTDGTNFGVVATNITASTYSESGLNQGTDYYWYVTATDTSGNESSASSTVSLSNIAVGSLSQDSETPEQIALYLPVTGTVASTATATVEYKPSGATTWIDAAPMWRILPQHSSKTVADAFAGVIFDLSPGSLYDVRVTVTEGSSTEVLPTLSASTRPLPRPRGPVTFTVTNQSELQTAISNASAGNVIQMTADITLSGRIDINGNSGTQNDPIYIVGEGRDTTTLTCLGDALRIRDISHWCFEDFTLAGSGVDGGASEDLAVAFFGDSGEPGGQTGHTFRRMHFDGWDRGILNGDYACHQTLVYDCVFTGNNDWDSYMGQSLQPTWDDDGVRLGGLGNCCWNCDFSGFGDAISFRKQDVTGDYTVAASYFYRNKILNSLDDALEAEYCERNCGAYDNYILNAASSWFSADGVFGGPLYLFRNRCINSFGKGILKVGAESSGILLWNNTFVGTEGSDNTDAGDAHIWYNAGSGQQPQGWEFKNNLILWEKISSGGGYNDDMLRFDRPLSEFEPLTWTHNGWGRDGDNLNFAHSGPTGDVATCNASLTPVMDNDIEITSQAAVFNTPVVFGTNATVRVTTEYDLALKASPEGSGAADPIDNISKGSDLGAYSEGFSPPIIGNRHTDTTSAPDYIATMSPFEVKTLNTVTGGYAIFDDIAASYNTAPKDWRNNDPNEGGFGKRWWRGWNGGFADTNYMASSIRHEFVFQGGGHNDGGCNIILGYDYNGTTAPVGYYTIDEPSDTADYINASSNGRYADGKPAAFHHFAGSCTSVTGQYIRMGGSIAATGGGTHPFVEVFTPGAGWRNPQPPNWPLGSFNGGVVYDAETNKVFGIKRGEFEYAFFDVASATFTTSGNYGGTNPAHAAATLVLDPIRRGAGDVTNMYVWPDNYVYQIDWANETFSYLGNHNAPGAAGLGNGGAYDARDDALYVFGNNTNSFSTVTKITGLDTPTSLTVQTNNLSQTVPVDVAGGFYGKWVFMPDWRAIGFAGIYNQPAVVIKVD